MGRIVRIDPEHVAYWFFRLNGCLTITNFMVHPHQGSDAKTEVDVIGVRFPHRIELDEAHQGPMIDHPIFSRSDADVNLTDVFFTEVKSHIAAINASWTYDNLTEMVKRIGPIDEHNISKVVDALLQHGIYCDKRYRVRLFTVSWVKSSELRIPLPAEQQLTWEGSSGILPFIHDRFQRYNTQKRNNNWAKNMQGRYLFDLASFEYDVFSRKILDGMAKFNNQ